jgi:hypothetical protein
VLPAHVKWLPSLKTAKTGRAKVLECRTDNVSATHGALASKTVEVAHVLMVWFGLQGRGSLSDVDSGLAF